MPHKQKENHDHSSKRKKERRHAKQEAIIRKQAIRDSLLAEEEEAAKLLGTNIIPLAEGHGAYEIGCDEPEEPNPRFNIKKRSKKHLRNDLRKKAEREDQECIERERLEQQRLWEQTQTQRQQQEEEEEEDIMDDECIMEYIIYICECCDKKYASRNQFFNHSKSKKHRELAKIYEEMGLIVTEVELRGANGNQFEQYNDNDDNNDNNDDDVHADVELLVGNEAHKTGFRGEAAGIGTAGRCAGDNTDNAANTNYVEQATAEVDDQEEEEEYLEEDEIDEEEQCKLERNANSFAAFALDDDDDDDNSTTTSSSSEDYADESEGISKFPQAITSPSSSMPKCDQEEAGDHQQQQQQQQDAEEINFAELIYQHRRIQIQNNIDAAAKATNNIDTTNNNSSLLPLVVPLPFDDTHDPDDYGANENRLAEVQHRLRKRLAAKGIARNTTNVVVVPHALDAISMGDTLLQQLMEANIDTLQAKLDAYKRHKQECRLLTREFALRKGNTKALPAQYVRKQDAADNAAKRAIVHHAGSHYHMQASRSMQFGRSKGLLARHSSQGARLQATRMANAETAQMQSRVGGMKAGKTSKKSKQKSQGEAGGSKKS